MGADEITDWMAFYLTRNEEFIRKLDSTPIAYDSADEEAEAFMKMILGKVK